MEKVSWDVNLKLDPEVFTGVPVEKEYLQGVMRDAARYRYLMANAVRMAPAGSDGPEHPKLDFYADIWNERPHQSAQTRITSKIDAAIKEQK